MFCRSCKPARLSMSSLTFLPCSWHRHGKNSRVTSICNFGLWIWKIRLGPQGFADGQFDLVLAANVLHATCDLRRGLGNVRKLLAPAGLLVLLEGTRPTRLLDLIFGLTEGWWKYTDTAVRPNYPLLSPDSWAKLLHEEKFKEQALVPAGVDHLALDQAVILALAPSLVPGRHYRFP